MAEITTDKLVRVFLKMREARSTIKDEYEAKDDKLKADMRAIEIELLRRAHDQGVEGFKCPAGTTYIADDVHVSIEDNSAFVEFLEGEEDPYGYFEQRASLKRVKEYQAQHDGMSPPGIHTFIEKRMRVRAAKGEA